MSATAAYAITTSETTVISIETVGTDLTANQYQEGYLYVNDGTGQGQSWKVKSHPAHDHSDDASCEITVYGKVSTALVASVILPSNPGVPSAPFSVTNLIALSKLLFATPIALTSFM